MYEGVSIKGLLPTLQEPAFFLIGSYGLANRSRTGTGMIPVAYI